MDLSGPLYLNMGKGKGKAISVQAHRPGKALRIPAG